MACAKALAGSLLLVLIACGGTEPTDDATADIKADGADGPVTVAAHGSVNLSWSSQNATSCLITPGGWSGITGSATVEDLTATTTYRLSCTGPGGEAEDTVHIVVPGTQIVFQAGDGTSADIYVVNADGSGLNRLTDYADADLAPSWSGDGRQIYFLSDNRDGRGTLDLYVMNADGSDAHLVVASIYPGGSPWPRRAYAVSPEGTRIALGATGPQNNLDLFVMNVDGSEPTLIADLPCDVQYTHCEYIQALAWSPDGQRIAYAACWPGHGSLECNIGVVNADGTGPELLASAGPNTELAWAPNGQRIVFSSGGTITSYFTPRDLEIINADGTGRMVLLDGDVDGTANTSPSWAPDGQSIAFARFYPVFTGVPEQSDVFAVNLDGTGLRRVTDAPGGAFAPDWNPAGP